MPLLDHRTAVVTGAAQGIGRAIATTFVEHGARVVVADLDPETAGLACEEINSAAGREATVAVACDVRSGEQVQRAVDTAVTRFGGLHVMVNNAGITRDATMRRMTEDDFRTVIDVHLTGTWHGTRIAAGHMRDHGGGSIVNVSSISGKVGMPGQTNYSAAKAGIVGLSKAAAKEVGHLGVRVNVVQPGLIRTPMTEAMPSRIWDQKLAEIPLGRAGGVDEVAGVALFLASDLSSYMTGTVQEISGGRFM